MHTHQFEQLLAAFSLWGFDTRGWSKRTRALYSYHVKIFETWLATQRGQTARKATRQEILAFLSTRPPSPSTRNSICTAVHAFFQFLHETDRRRDIPSANIARFRRSESVPKALDAQTVDVVLAGANASGPYARAVVSTLLFTGVRSAELRALEWTALEGDAWLRVHGKGDKTRMLPLHRNVRSALREWRAEVRPSRFMFPSPVNTEHQISPTSIAKVVKMVGTRTGVPTLHPHMCRHSFASRLTEQGVDIRVVQELLGHASVATTQIYTRVRPLGLVAAMELLSFGGT